MTLIEEIAKIISDTNQPGRWAATGRTERERRIKEAEAVLEHLASLMPSVLAFLKVKES